MTPQQIAHELDVAAWRRFNRPKRRRMVLPLLPYAPWVCVAVALAWWVVR